MRAEKELFFRFAPKLMTICRRYAISDDDAKDYLQESFLQIYGKIEQYDFEKGEFEGWIYRVCTNTVLQILRKNKRDTPVIYMDQLPENGIQEEEFDELPTEELITAIQQLPDGYRNVVNLYIFEKWSHKQISEKLDITESSSRSQLTRAKQLLKQILLKNLPGRYEKILAGKKIG